jgi:hypothetical protein
MQTTEHADFNLKGCYIKAWKSFAKWWIPICVVSGFLMLVELGPKQLARAESAAISQMLTESITAYRQGNAAEFEQRILELNQACLIYSKKLVLFTSYAAPIMALLTILLVGASVMAVKDQRARYSPRHVLIVSFLNLIITTFKILSLFLFLPFGIYIYIKLYFVSLLMLEENQGPATAVRESWKMTGGHFRSLCGMAAINTILQVAMAPTIIGLVPATGFVTTARVAAFMGLRKKPSISE